VVSEATSISHNQKRLSFM